MQITGRPASVTIDLDALDHNFTAIRALAGNKKIISIVKDNAYGHGGREIVRRIGRCSDFLGVASVDEALALRRQAKGKKFIIICGIFPGEEKLISDDMVPVVYDFEGLSRLKKIKRKCSINIEFDTGMGRTGFQPGDAGRVISMLREMKHIGLQGVMSHFSSAESDPDFTNGQCALFLKILSKLKKNGFNPELVHLANSAGMFYELPAVINGVRPGIMLYGGYPSESHRRMITLEPVMEFRTRIIALKKIKKGTPVSYGRTYKAARDSVIATLAAGYGDGYPRSLSNRGTVYVDGKGLAPVTGRVCMDMTMADVTGLAGVKTGDDVVLWGKGPEEVHPDRVAAQAGTISYELFCCVTSRVKRFVRSRHG